MGENPRPFPPDSGDADTGDRRNEHNIVNWSGFNEIFSVGTGMARPGSGGDAVVKTVWRQIHRAEKRLNDYIIIFNDNTNLIQGPRGDTKTNLYLFVRLRVGTPAKWIWR